MNLQKDIQKFKSKVVIITGDFYLRDLQIEKEEKDWLYPQIIESMHLKNVTTFLKIL